LPEDALNCDEYQPQQLVQSGCKDTLNDQPVAS